MNKIETIKTPMLSGHGTFMYGKLDELDFTVQGKGTDNQGKPISWGNSVKLKFIVTKKAIKSLMGIDKEYDKTVFEYLNIECESEEEIATKLALFEEYKGKDILVPIENTKEKTTYKINEKNLTIIDISQKVS